MHDWAIFGKDAEWFWVMIQAVLVVGTGILILVQLRLQRKSHALQNNSHVITAFEALHQRWTSEMMLRARTHVCKRYRVDPNKAAAIDFGAFQIGQFFEELGGYCRLGHLDKNLCWENYSYFVEHYWVILQHDIGRLREYFGNDPSYFYQFEQLYEDFRNENKKRNVPFGIKSPEKVQSFVEFECGSIQFLERGGQTEFSFKPRASGATGKE